MLNVCDLFLKVVFMREVYCSLCNTIPLCNKSALSQKLSSFIVMQLIRGTLLSFSSC